MPRVHVGQEIRGRVLALLRTCVRGEGAAGRTGLVFAAFALTLVVLGTAQAHAAITPQPSDTSGANAIANAIAAPSAGGVTGSYDAVPPSGTPNGTADALGVFPTDGAGFGILTSGDVNLADDPNTSGGSGAAIGGGSVRGNTDFDVSILKIDLVAPQNANCLTIDFAFYSDEFPEFVGSSFNDAFIAELDTSNWTTSGSTITAPNNFAFDEGGNVISINSTGATSMNAANAAGTTYDGATTLLSAATPVSAGAHSLYLSIFDQGDQILDSAAFVDNLALITVPDPNTDCQPGAQPVEFKLSLDPATAENEQGSQHTVTATLTKLVDLEDQPVEGATISFAVSGDNTAGGTGTTDANGHATFTYTGTNAGADTITACFDETGDGPCEATASAGKTWTPGPTNSPPDCAGVTADLKKLWPPNHKYRLITLSGGTDPDGDPITLTIAGVTQDEPLNGTGDGDTSPDAKAGPDSNKVYVRAERKGNGNGRVYRISFTVSDGKGESCSGNVTVGVPHDQGGSKTPVDSGQTVNSFG